MRLVIITLGFLSLACAVHAPMSETVIYNPKKFEDEPFHSKLHVSANIEETRIMDDSYTKGDETVDIEQPIFDLPYSLAYQMHLTV